MRSTNILIFLFLLQTAFSTHAASIEEMNKEYNSTTTRILEFLYNPGHLSQGGTAAIDRMFRGISLHKKNLVNVGCGLGGENIHLAKKHQVTITGLDPMQRFIDRAQQTAAQQKLDKKITYICTPQLPYSLADNSFDVAFSKEALLHCSEKANLLKEVFRILKPGGCVVIIDWLFAENTCKETLELFNIPTFSPATTKEYVAYLTNAGFTNISTTVENKEYCRHTQHALDRLKKNKAIVSAKFGTDEYNLALESWNGQYDLFTKKELLVTRLKAFKAIAPTSKTQPQTIFQKIKHFFLQIPKLIFSKNE